MLGRSTIVTMCLIHWSFSYLDRPIYEISRLVLKTSQAARSYASSMRVNSARVQRN